MKHILAVDIGTTSSKALVVSETGEVLASSQEFYSMRSPHPDYAEQDPQEIFTAVKKIIRNATGQVKGKVDGVSFSSAMHSLILVDKGGDAITPMITWADLRSKDEALELKRSPAGQIIYQETGTPIHSMSPLCKILWFKKHEPALFGRAFKFIGIREYIGSKLFGEYTIDHSIASATGLFNGVARTWCAKSLEVTGLSSDHLSTPRSVYHISKIKDRTLASDLGLSPDIPWMLGASDGCMANLGSGAMDGKTLSVTVGTSGAVRKSVKKINPDPLGRTFHYLLDEENIVTGGASNNGAVLVQWYSEKFLKEKIDVNSFGERAATTPVGADGLIFLPYVLGERAPIYDTEATGVFFGVRRQHGPEHFMRAILEGIGYALYSISEIIESNSGVCNQVMASGGFTRSPHWVQMMADIFGKEFNVHGAADASALGAALIGFKALGVGTRFEFPTEKVFYPDPVRHEKYLTFFSIYKSLYPHLSSDFLALGKLS